MEATEIFSLLTFDASAITEGPNLLKTLLEEGGKIGKVVIKDLLSRQINRENLADIKPPKNSRRVRSFSEVAIGAHVARVNEGKANKFDHIWVRDIIESGSGEFSYYECVNIPNSKRATVVLHSEVITKDTERLFFDVPTYVVRTKQKNSFQKCLQIANDEEGLEYRFWDDNQSEQFVLDVLQGKGLPVPQNSERVFEMADVPIGAHLARFVEKKSIHDRFNHMWVEEIDEQKEVFSYVTCEPLDKYSNYAVVNRHSLKMSSDFKDDFFRVPVYIIDCKDYDRTFEQSKSFARELYEGRQQFRCDGVFFVWDSYSSADVPYFIKTGSIAVKTQGFKRLVKSPQECFDKRNRVSTERLVNLRSLTLDEEIAKSLKAGTKSSLQNLRKTELLPLVQYQIANHPKCPGWVSNLLQENLDDMVAVARKGALKMTPKAARNSIISAAIINGGRFVTETMMCRKTLDAMLKEGEITEDQRDFYLRKCAKTSAAGNLTSFAVLAVGTGFCVLLPISGVALIPVFIGTAVVGTAGESLSRHLVAESVGNLENEENGEEKKTRKLCYKHRQP